MIQELGDIDPLATLPNLKMLSLLQNPVAHLQHYRAYVVYKLPQLKVLDFKKIKLKVSINLWWAIIIFGVLMFSWYEYDLKGKKRSHCVIQEQKRKRTYKKYC